MQRVSWRRTFRRDLKLARARAGSLMLETRGSMPVLTEFFKEQMRGRHNIRWYAELGATFFNRAAMQEPSSSKARLLDSIARRFETWRQRHARLSRDLRDQPLLLVPPRPAGSAGR